MTASGAETVAASGARTARGRGIAVPSPAAVALRFAAERKPACQQGRCQPADHRSHWTLHHLNWIDDATSWPEAHYFLAPDLYPLACIFQCAVNTEQDSRGRENPTRQLSLRRKQSGRALLATAAGEAPDVKGSCKRVSERAGPNMSEHRASLEKGNANADPLETRGRLTGRRKRTKRALRPYRRGMGEDMRTRESCGNTGNPTRREVKAPDQQPARARLGCEGWRRGSYERGSRAMPVEQRSLSSRTMTKEGKARRLA